MTKVASSHPLADTYSGFNMHFIWPLSLAVRMQKRTLGYWESTLHFPVHGKFKGLGKIFSLKQITPPTFLFGRNVDDIVPAQQVFRQRPIGAPKSEFGIQKNWAMIVGWLKHPQTYSEIG